MSKHPIPDWLRSQFSRIEDEVQKLGPCGVFTQMRTVTQTYFEQQAEAAQPPALGGEQEIQVMGRVWRLFDGNVSAALNSVGRELPDGTPLVSLHDHRAHLAPLQAEIERQSLLLELSYESHKQTLQELDCLKVRCDELEHRAADVVEGFDGEQLPGAMTMRIRKLKAAMSKPADYQSQRPTLRAMARNYRNGHSWDHLDGEACIKAADEIDRLTYELNCSKGLANLTIGNLNEAKEEIDQLKARCDELKVECDAWKNTSESFEDFYRKTEAECDQLKALLVLANAALEGRIDAALSKPAGSEKV
ncbi:hypothetical protein PSYMO_05600 [Pseudomonas amygdali pv. mori str. 301020]|uniref:Uncharacterized protein n=1 Tax=Pseudomonas amygdali pv. mori str. 301020 TaxID=629261 RepID=A0A656G5D4_PSEA0|nr:hypothetical protein PSYMO_05600 [Pseudomonas amygdali pv. mori str. 301020]